MYGVRNATRLALRRIRAPKVRATTGIPAPVTFPRLMAGPTLPPIDKSVSVIIPTKNAGVEFHRLLQKLAVQKGVRICEVLIVDSGSADGTVEIAQEQGAKIVRIAPNEFTHAYARNKGAEGATGDYLLFLVQDAVPLTDAWLWQMAGALESNGVVAVSCAEYPRADSDLFYQFLIHSQYSAAGCEQDQIYAWDESCTSSPGLRSRSRLSDVAALLRRDIFERYRYRTDYAEDIELGARLIQDGHKLAFLCSTRVLHSHRRPAYYFLKRGYVDARYRGEIFSDSVYPRLNDKRHLYGDIADVYKRIGGVAECLSRQKFPLPLPAFLEQVRENMSASPGVNSGVGIDPELREFIDELCASADINRNLLNRNSSMLLPHIRDHFEKFQRWVCYVHETAEESLAREIISALEKLFALHCGTHLGYLFLTCSGQQSRDEALFQMDQRLTAGV